MASADAGRGPGRRAWRFLASSDTAVWTLLAIAILFLLASLVREATPGAYEGLQGDDIRFFLLRPRLLDSWFWAILLGCLLLGLSLACCTLDALRRHFRLGIRDPRAYGTILAHAGAGLALLAHAVSGWAGSQSFGMVGREPAVVGGVSVRLLDARATHFQDGEIRSQEVRIEFTPRDGRVRRASCAPNDPIRWAGGTEMLLLMGLRPIAAGCVLSIDGSRDTLGVGDVRALADGGKLVLERIFGPPEYRTQIARVRVTGGPRAGTHLLASGMRSDASGIEMLSVEVDSAAIIAYRHAPGTVYLLAGGIALGVGVVLSALRRIRGERERANWRNE